MTESCMDKVRRSKEKALPVEVSYNEMRGFSLAELLVAMVIGLVILGAGYNLIIIQNKTLSSQEQIVEMQQNVRTALDMMTREVRLAGYNPAGAAFSGITVNASQLEVKADLDGNASLSGQEDIVYSLSPQTTNFLK